MPGKTVPARWNAITDSGFNEAPAKCRGKRRAGTGRSRRRIRFNEAPAKCRGKPPEDAKPIPAVASFNEAPAKCRGKPTMPTGTLSGYMASMRPQRNAGENNFPCHRKSVVESASMRPQRNAGENAPITSRIASERGASMRPQRNAGENNVALLDYDIIRIGFNEAPAKCRGKLPVCIPETNKQARLQ